MAPCYLLCLLVLCYFPFLLLAQSGIKQKYYGNCPLYSHCGNYGDIYFPFSNTTGSKCGLPISGCDNSGKKAEVQLWGEIWCEIDTFYRNKTQGPDLLVVQDNEYQKYLPKNCSDFDHDIFAPSSSIFEIFHLENIITMYRCNRTHNLNLPESFFNYTKCPHYDILYRIPPEDGNFDQYFPTSSCSKIQIPFDPQKFRELGSPNVEDPFIFMTSKLQIKVNLPQECVECYKTGDICSDDGGIYCSKVSTPAAAKEKPPIWKVVMIGLGVGCSLTAILIIGCLIGHRLHKRKHTPSDVDHPESSDTFADPDPESGSVYFRVPLFSYEELQEATKSFDREREIGAGGFGTVYYGNIRDGREVAVKRLYQRNYKRFKHFMNEFEILTRLRHRNLVSLYGCTSHDSREPLPVYEYIPNGTVACHLHGGLAHPGSLPWSVRMRIAIETATALAYLHASGIIHRDVKTKNVLLDHHFCVKVADFGLSRFFPYDVTHVSTDPHGTPGYLDPEYYECYQLSDKSDVYSFGVILIELISSMPPIDMTRRREEINLATLAKRKIQDSALSELVDHSLGFESDNEVKRMIVSVAELAFQCLQLVRGLRPTMDQVLEMLERIENGTD